MERVSVKYVFDRKKEANNSTKQGLLQIEVRILGSTKKTYIFPASLTDRTTTYLFPAFSACS